MACAQIGGTLTAVVHLDDRIPGVIHIRQRHTRTRRNRLVHPNDISERQIVIGSIVGPVRGGEKGRAGVGLEERVRGGERRAGGGDEEQK